MLKSDLYDYCSVLIVVKGCCKLSNIKKVSAIKNSSFKT